MAGDSPGTPFRDAPRMLECPRCGENLERITDGVQSCARCEGIWLARVRIEGTFGTPYWPKGPSAWWRRELGCPACSVENRGAQMTPVLVGDLLVDRCVEHGVWLDAGELGRLLDAPRAIELEAFYELLRPGGQVPGPLVEFRRVRDAKREQQLKELEAYRVKVEAEEAERRAAVERERAAERARMEAENARLREEARVAMRAALVSRQKRIELDVTAAERKVNDLRGKVRDREAALGIAQELLRSGEAELGAARERMLAVQREIDELK